MTKQEMIARSKAKGNNFFTADTMRFWGCKIETAPNRFGLFITSDDNFDATRKLYSVRCFNANTGEVNTLSFQQHETLEAADMLRRDITSGLAACTREFGLTNIDKASVLDDGHFIVTLADGTTKELNHNTATICPA